MTSTYSSSALIAFNLLFLSGCTALPPAIFPDAPPDWQIVSSWSREADSCRSMGGMYLMSAKQITYSEGNWTPQATSDLAFYSGLVGPAKAAQIPESQIKMDDLNIDYAMRDKSFLLLIDAANDLYLNYFVNNSGSYSLHFASDKDDFSCENSTIRFPARIDVTGGEGVQANSQRIRVMGLNIDGDLILYDSNSPARLSPKAPEPVFSILKFTRKNGS